MAVLILLLVVIILFLLIYFFIIKPLLMPNNVINRYHFQVDWGGSTNSFMEVSGLDIEIEAVSFRDGSSPEDSVRKIPGLRKYADITLKRAIVQGDNEFFTWISTKKIGSIEVRDVTISLLDGDHNPVVVWKVKKAFPIKYIGPVLNASNSDLAIETLVITHEGFVIENRD